MFLNFSKDYLLKIVLVNLIPIMEFSIEIVILLSMCREKEREKKIKTHFPAVDFWSIEMDINNLIHLAISLVGLVGLLSSLAPTLKIMRAPKKQLLKFSDKLLISIKNCCYYN